MGRLYTPHSIQGLELAFLVAGVNIWEQVGIIKVKIGLVAGVNIWGLTSGHRMVLSRSTLVTSSPNMASGAPSTPKVSLPTCGVVDIEWVSMTKLAS